MNENKPASGASAATVTDTTATKEVQQTIPYATSGEVFTTFINRRLSERGNVTIPLGTKRASVNRLLPDGRLEVEVPDADASTSEKQWVAFDATMLDLLVPELVKV